MTPLFVYGTLKRGYRNHRLIEDQTFISEVSTEPVYRLYDNGHYPCLVADESSGLAIQGELYLIEERLFRHLDRLEGVPDLYLRETVLLQHEEYHRATGYVYIQDVSAFVECGPCWV